MLTTEIKIGDTVYNKKRYKPFGHPIAILPGMRGEVLSIDQEGRAKLAIPGYSTPVDGFKVTNLTHKTW